ncbi:response regulator [Thermodesulfobacteriota bacterium]
MDKVLIVDDDLKFLNSLKAGLQKYSQFEILTAAHGLEALDVLKKTRISVLVTDLEMPEMDGRALLDYMKKNRPQIPCIVMTDKESPESENEADRDILQYIEKPFDFNQLFAVILEGLDRLDEGIFWKAHRK